MKAHFLPLLLVLACGEDPGANVRGSSGKGGTAGASVGGSSGKGGAAANGGTSNDNAGAGGEATGGSNSTRGSSGKGGSSGSSGSSGKGGSSGSSNQPTGPFSSFQRADVVIGQKDFESNAKPSKVGAAVTDYTPGSAAFDGKRLFVSDSYSARVLGFSSLPTSNGAAAKLVLGQGSTASSAPGTSLDKLYQPQALHTDGTTLAIADAGNHRVLLMPTSAPTGASASVLIGWPDAATQRNGCSAVLLHSPASAFITKGKLLVADRANHRVLIWSKLPKSAGVPADLVLGQTSLTSCAANDASHTGTMGLRAQDTLNGPTDVWSDGKRILVADRDNNRVLLWSEFPTENGVPADVVIGQTAFGVARNNAAANVLLHPSALAFDGTTLLIADTGHNRVLGWDGIPKDSGADAVFVLGQKDFKHVNANDDAQKGKDGTAPTDRTLALPSGVAFAGDSLVVSDTLNRRVLVFQKR